MRIRYPGVQNNLVDREGPDMQLIPGAWRDEGVMRDIDNVQGGNVATKAQEQRVYLKHYYNTVDSVSWQNEMI